MRRRVIVMMTMMMMMMMRRKRVIVMMMIVMERRRALMTIWSAFQRDGKKETETVARGLEMPRYLSCPIPSYIGYIGYLSYPVLPYANWMKILPALL